MEGKNRSDIQADIIHILSDFDSFLDTVFESPNSGCHSRKISDSPVIHPTCKIKERKNAQSLVSEQSLSSSGSSLARTEDLLDVSKRKEESKLRLKQADDSVSQTAQLQGSTESGNDGGRTLVGFYGAKSTTADKSDNVKGIRNLPSRNEITTTQNLTRFNDKGPAGSEQNKDIEQIGKYYKGIDRGKSLLDSSTTGKTVSSQITRSTEKLNNFSKSKESLNSDSHFEISGKSLDNNDKDDVREMVVFPNEVFREKCISTPTESAVKPTQNVKKKEEKYNKICALQRLLCTSSTAYSEEDKSKLYKPVSSVSKEEISNPILTSTTANLQPLDVVASYSFYPSSSHSPERKENLGKLNYQKSFLPKSTIKDVEGKYHPKSVPQFIRMDRQHFSVDDNQLLKFDKLIKEFNVTKSVSETLSSDAKGPASYPSLYTDLHCKESMSKMGKSLKLEDCVPTISSTSKSKIGKSFKFEESVTSSEEMTRSRQEKILKTEEKSKKKESEKKQESKKKQQSEKKQENKKKQQHQEIPSTRPSIGAAADETSKGTSDEVKGVSENKPSSKLKSLWLSLSPLPYKSVVSRTTPNEGGKKKEVDSPKLPRPHPKENGEEETPLTPEQELKLLHRLDNLLSSRSAKIAAGIMSVEHRGTKALELWTRRVTEGYPGVNISNMTTSWRDGLAFCALIHHFRPDLIDVKSLKAENILENNALAFRVAEQHLGIPALLDAEDMVETEVPDRLSILTYVSQFYQAFSALGLIGPGGRRSPIATNNLKNKSEDSKTPPPKPTSAPVSSSSKAQPISQPPATLQTKTEQSGFKTDKVTVVARGRREECVACRKTVFLAERIVVGFPGQLRHRTCFRCDRCSGQLTLASYYETEKGQFCCETCPDEERPVSSAEEDETAGNGSPCPEIYCSESDSESDSESGDSSESENSSSANSPFASHPVAPERRSLNPSPQPPTPRTVFLRTTLEPSPPPSPPPKPPRSDTPLTPQTDSFSQQLSPSLDETDVPVPSPTAADNTGDPRPPPPPSSGPIRCDDAKGQETPPPGTLLDMGQVDLQSQSPATHQTPRVPEEKEPKIEPNIKELKKIFEWSDDRTTTTNLNTSKTLTSELGEDTEKCMDQKETAARRESEISNATKMSLVPNERKALPSTEVEANLPHIIDGNVTAVPFAQSLVDDLNMQSVTNKDDYSNSTNHNEKSIISSSTKDNVCNLSPKEQHSNRKAFSDNSVKLADNAYDMCKDLTEEEFTKKREIEIDEDVENKKLPPNDININIHDHEIEIEIKENKEIKENIDNSNKCSHESTIKTKGACPELTKEEFNEVDEKENLERMDKTVSLQIEDTEKGESLEDLSDAQPVNKILKENEQVGRLSMKESLIEENTAKVKYETKEDEEARPSRITLEDMNSSKREEVSSDNNNTIGKVDDEDNKGEKKFDYPQDLNPFDSEEDESEAVKVATQEASTKTEDPPLSPPPTGSDEETSNKRQVIKAPLNPFESDDEDGIEDISHSLATATKVKKDEKSLNPFMSDEEDSSSSPSASKGKVKPPRPPPPTLKRDAVLPSNRKLILPSNPCDPAYKPHWGPSPPSPTLSVRSSSSDQSTNLRLKKKLRQAPAPPPAGSSPSSRRETALRENERESDKKDVIKDDALTVKMQKDLKNHTSKMMLKGGVSAPKSESGEWRRKKGPAPSRPVPQKRVTRKLPMRQVQQELQDIDVKQTELERQGVLLETAIRDRTERGLTPSGSDESGSVLSMSTTNSEGEKSCSSSTSSCYPGMEIEDMILQLFELVNEKNELFRRQTELMYIKRERRLEEEYAELEYQIRCLMLKPPSERNEADALQEEELIARLMKVVEQRDAVVNCLEMERQREAIENESIATHMIKYQERHIEGIESDEGKKIKKKKKLRLLKKKKKKKDKEKEKSTKIDADKDVDETEVKKKKKTWFKKPISS